MASKMIHPTTKLTGLAKWWAKTRDVPEVMPLYGWLLFAFGLNVNLRGDPELQANTPTVATQDPEHKKHSVWWHVAQIKMDEDGANIGIFNNRVRPHQYSKPGHSGMGAGVPGGH